MSILLYDDYPDIISHPDGLLIAFKLVPVGLPKCGPPISGTESLFAVVYAANKAYTPEGDPLHQWERYHWLTQEDQHQQDAFVLSLNLAPNRWYFIDDNQENENEEDSSSEIEAD